MELHIGYLPRVHCELLSPNRVLLENLNSLSLEVDGPDSFALVTR